LKPRYWCVENVWGAIPDFKELLGEPRQIIGPFVLWGNFPYIDVPRNFIHSKTGYTHQKNIVEDRTSAVRAKIPLEISQGLLTALESQTNITSWS
jgi:hypothetical protein